MKQQGQGITVVGTGNIRPSDMYILGQAVQAHITEVEKRKKVCWWQQVKQNTLAYIILTLHRLLWSRMRRKLQLDFSNPILL